MIVKPALAAMLASGLGGRGEERFEIELLSTS
jgi:hypothetical protein